MAGCDAFIVMILQSLSQFFGGFAYAAYDMLDFTIPIYSILRHHLLEHYSEYQIRLEI